MLMSDEEVNERLNSPSNLVTIIQKNKGGGTKGSTRIPPSVRNLIAITAGSSDETQQSVAEEFGIDASSVSEIKKGLVGGKLDKDLQAVGREASKTREDDAHEAALDCLMTTLSSLQPKLVDPEMKAKDLSRIASDMSKVASNLKPKSKEDEGRANTTVVLVRPSARSIDKYDFIDV